MTLSLRAYLDALLPLPPSAPPAEPSPWAARERDTARPSSPCPALEAAARAAAEAGPVEVEPDSGPVTRRGLDLELACYLAAPCEGDRAALLPPPWAPPAAAADATRRTR